MRQYKKVDQFDLEGNYIKTFNNTREAAEAVFITQGALRMCLSRKNSSSAGFKWKYTEK